jgi:hypothetical protein
MEATMRRSFRMSGIVVLLGISISFVGAPQADVDADAADTPPAENDAEYFQLTSTGGAEILYEDLSPEEQADVDRAAETVEATQGDAVAELAELSRQTAERAHAQAAAMTLGLEGLDSEGIVP